MTAAGAIGGPVVGNPAAPWPRPFVQGLYWTEMTVGSAYSTSSRTVTEVDLMRFVSMGFTEPLFTDAAGAEAAGYRGRLVPGALTFSLAEGLLMQTNVIHGSRKSRTPISISAWARYSASQTLTRS